MTAIIADSNLQQRLIEERRESGADRYDEVWEGVYFMAPAPDNEHHDIVDDLGTILTIVVKWTGLGRVHAGANVSDRETDWTKNYRCPDILVFLNNNPAEDRGTHWFGGPDLAIEVVSEGDRSYEKLAFYAGVNTNEVLIVDREPWELVLFRRAGDAMIEVGRSTSEVPQQLVSEVVPLAWQLVAGDKGPEIEVAHHDGQQEWTIRNFS